MVTLKCLGGGIGLSYGCVSAKSRFKLLQGNVNRSNNFYFCTSLYLDTQTSLFPGLFGRKDSSTVINQGLSKIFGIFTGFST